MPFPFWEWEERGWSYVLANKEWNMKKSLRKHCGVFKAKVSLAAIKVDETAV